MAKDIKRIRKIYDRTDGHCHICHKKLSITNYGKRQARGAWSVDHSKARANGGSDHMNNLYAACIDCNTDKSTFHTRTARAWHGKKRAPHSRKKKAAIRKSNTAKGAFIGGVIGTAFGPVGTALGAFIGGAIGNNSSPNK